MTESQDLYKASGVDVAKGDRLVNWLQSSTEQSTAFPGGELISAGGFAGLFRPNFGSMKDPLLVSGTDGVGTKVVLGIEQNQLAGLGIDLVAMCVNDLYTLGARPMFFLDYYATGSLDEAQFKEVLTGIRRGCQQSEMALVGGETAEMPGLYKKGDFDLAGFVVGAVDGETMLGPHRVTSGDKLYGLASSGFHSNGYSLIRKWLNESPQSSDDPRKLLAPTRIYHEIPGLLERVGPSGLHALANITGGGFTGNVCRFLPQDLDAHIDLQALRTPDWMRHFIEARGKTLADVEGVFNLGAGMVASIAADRTNDFETAAKEADLEVFAIGSVVTGNGAVKFT